MSGANTKASKIDRILARLTELSNSLKLAIATISRLEAENARLRKYLGGELFKRRQREPQIPTLVPGPCVCSVCCTLRAQSTR